MDVVWLKKDVRIHDHGPLYTAASASKPFCILYLYEPDQLRHHSVHGSHVQFSNEGLQDLNGRLLDLFPRERPKPESAIMFMHGEAVECFKKLHQERKIGRILAHMETGHLASFARDRRVKKWCRENLVELKEFNQTGVTRGLKDRNKFTANYNAVMDRPPFPRASPLKITTFLITDLPGNTGILDISSLAELEYPEDRPERQSGGETQATYILESFLRSRGKTYSTGISSPNSSWNSCSRLSPYLTFGHISLRTVLHATKVRRAEMKQSGGVRQSGGIEKQWERSLNAFHSRLRWRSHFIQKLESEPEIEIRAQCKAYNDLRTANGDWRDDLYAAWASGRTGYPMVDACMRCLLRHGWVNFRMRAMLCSFAAYNMFLDWRGIAPHLARCFLDYEPGIHYPQLQMQSGVTGINAMRVYSVTKQAMDQDPQGSFIRKHLPELSAVPTQYIHEPWKMSHEQQVLCGTIIVSDESSEPSLEGKFRTYPRPVVNERESARQAKERVSAIRKLRNTKEQAKEVYDRHGSRKRAESDFLRAESRGRTPQKRKRATDGQQTKITSLFKIKEISTQPFVQDRMPVDQAPTKLPGKVDRSDSAPIEPLGEESIERLDPKRGPILRPLSGILKCRERKGSIETAEAEVVKCSPGHANCHIPSLSRESCVGSTMPDRTAHAFPGCQSEGISPQRLQEGLGVRIDLGPAATALASPTATRVVDCIDLTLL